MPERKLGHRGGRENLANSKLKEFIRIKDNHCIWFFTFVSLSLFISPLSVSPRSQNSPVLFPICDKISHIFPLLGITTCFWLSSCLKFLFRRDSVNAFCKILCVKCYSPCIFLWCHSQVDILIVLLLRSRLEFVQCRESECHYQYTTSWLISWYKDNDVITR